MHNTLTLLNSAQANTVINYDNGSGTSIHTNVITVTASLGSSVAVYNQVDTRVHYVEFYTQPLIFYIGPLAIGATWTAKASLYGYVSVSVSQVVSTYQLSRSTIDVVPVVVDPGITQVNVATVAAYTTLNTLDKLYDYASYYNTTSAGIDLTKPFSKVGLVLDAASYNLVFDATASVPYTFNGSIPTIKASEIADGTTFTSLTTSGTVTYNNGATFNTIITSAAGTTGKFTISGLDYHNIYVENATPVQMDYATGVSSYTLWIAAGSSGTWRWRAVKYGNVPETGTFSAASGGRITAAVLNTVDLNISQPDLSTVLAYSNLFTWDRFYDYCQAYLTTSNGKALNQIASKNGAAVDIGSYSLLIDATASTIFNLSSGITIKADVLYGGYLFQGVSTTSTISVSNGARINTWYTSVDGRSVLVLAPNIARGSRFQLFNMISYIEIANDIVSESVVSGVHYRMRWPADVTVRLRVTQQSGTAAENEIESFGLLTSTGLTFLDYQTPDQVYTANNIDGSTVTEFTTDLGNVQIDISDPDGVTTVQRIYAWYRYIITTADGIRSLFRGIVAPDTANYKINTSAVNLKLDNVNNAPVMVVGGYLSRSDGSSVIATTSNSIQMDPARVYVATSSFSGATISEIEASSILAKEATVTSRLAASAYTAPDNSSVAAIKTKTDQLVFSSGRVNAAIDTSLLAKTSDIVSAQTSLATLIGAIPTTPLLTSDSRLNNLDVTISSRLASSSYITPPTTGAIVTAVEASTILAKEATSSKIKGIVSTLL